MTTYDKSGLVPVESRKRIKLTRFWRTTDRTEYTETWVLAINWHMVAASDGDLNYSPLSPESMESYQTMFDLVEDINE